MIGNDWQYSDKTGFRIIWALPFIVYACLCLNEQVKAFPVYK